MFKVAAVQMVSTDSVAENLQSAAALIAKAAGAGARLITLPENFAFMGQHDADRLALKESRDGPLQTFLSKEAKTHGVWLLGGTIPLHSGTPDKVYAASLLYHPDGHCAGHYNKVHLFDAAVDEETGEAYRESDTFLAGDTAGVVVATELGNIGLSVCYDLRFPELYRQMPDVDLITAPSAFTATTGAVHWETLVRARAIENLSYVIASNQGGTHVNGRETWGHSMIVDPWGTILAEVTDAGPGLALADIDPDRQQQLRQTFPALQHRQPDNQRT